jgi:glycosyltransferase involved in cell wall biosynthesis
MHMLISVVIPVYQAENIIEELLRRLSAALHFTEGSYEIILVDDGSADNSWQKIIQFSTGNSAIKGIKLSRNFGQHHAITAGIDFCQGNWVVVMDCDLQDKPEEIEMLYNTAVNGFDIVYAKRIHRTDSFLKKISSKIFYRLFSYLTGIKYDGTIANFGIYNKKVINVIKTMKEPMRAFAPMIRWVGFKSTAVNVAHGERQSGKTTYTLKKLFRLAFDIILSYSDKPLKIITRLGFFISFTSFIAAIVTVVRYFNGAITVSGYTSIIISIWFLSGLIILILGVIGLYISKIFAGIKNRPLYIIDETISITT